MLRGFELWKPMNEQIHIWILHIANFHPFQALKSTESITLLIETWQPLLCSRGGQRCGKVATEHGITGLYAGRFGNGPILQELSRLKNRDSPVQKMPFFKRKKRTCFCGRYHWMILVFFAPLTLNDLGSEMIWVWFPRFLVVESAHVHEISHMIIALAAQSRNIYIIGNCGKIMPTFAAAESWVLNTLSRS